MSRAALTAILDDAAGRVADVSARSGEARSASSPELAGCVIANLFFEDSTRTRCSFSVAAMRLGGQTIEFSGVGSSVSKGETLVDTALNIEAMGVNGIVVRAKPAGAAVAISRAVTCPVINAGDGAHEHPTQGLLDMLTLRHHLGDLDGRTIGIVGDIGNSRVARSDVYGLTALGTKVRLIGPPTLVPASFASFADGDAVTVHHSLDDQLADLDAIIMLRVQFERGTGISRDYRQMYGLSRKRLDAMPAHAVVMHPGPMNRGLEIDSDVADDAVRSVILQQVSHGVAVRMAVLAALVRPS